LREKSTPPSRFSAEAASPYNKGAPAYYILCYGTLAYVLSHFMLPPIWRYAKEHRLYSESDFFRPQV
jgi:Na+/proline symporter